MVKQCVDCGNLRFVWEDRILKICVLASSSSGNSLFIGDGYTRLLVDAGLCRREIIERLAAIGEDAESLTAVLVTHEHCDHVSGLVPLLRKFNTENHHLPVYLSRLTAPSIVWGDFVPPVQTFQAGECFGIGDFQIQSFTVPHDAVDPVGFCISAGGVRIGVATDLGYIPASVKHHLRGADFLVLESNHDLEMLKVGPYPWSVKQRVMGRNGHLSNEAVSDFILNDMDPCLRTLILGHISEHNNYPAMVHMAAVRAIGRRLIHPDLVVVEPGMRSQVFEV